MSERAGYHAAPYGESLMIAIDPGTEQSGVVAVDFDGADIHIHRAEIVRNVDLEIQEWQASHGLEVVCEMVACYGMPVGAEVFETCLWIGEFRCSAGRQFFHTLTRNEIKLTLCHSTRGVTDSVIRQRLIDLYGPIGTKKSPGPLYGIRSHLWSAVAVAAAWHLRSAMNGT